MSLFQKVFMINMPLSCPCSVKKHQFCQKYTILLAPRVNRMPFFLIFLEKITALMPIFCQRNVHSLKITLPSCPNFVKKTSIFSKKLCYHVIFFKFFIKNPLLSCPYLIKKCKFCLNYTKFMGQKCQQNALFSDFSQQRLLSCSYYSL